MLSVAQAAKKYEIEPHQLRNWISHGYILAEPTHGIGRGGVVYEISWDEEEVLEAMVLLNRAGMQPGKAAIAARGEDAPIRALQRAIDKCNAIRARRRSLASGG